MNNFLVALLKPCAWIAKLLLVTVIAGIAVLAHLGHLIPITQFLDSEALTFKVANYRLSALFVCKIIFSVILLFWLTGIVSNFGEQKIRKFRCMRSNNRALLTKALMIQRVG